MSKTITFINEKGGVGKTSACFNAAWELANRGKRILMIDMDGQKANLTFFTGADSMIDNMQTMADVFKKDLPITSCIFHLKDNLDLVPANADMVNIGMEAKVIKFRKSLQEVTESYDYIFIDVNPAPGWSHYLSLSVSDYAIVVMLPDIASLEGNKGILETIEEIQGTSNPNLQILGFLFNKSNNRTVLAKQVLDAADAMAAHYGTKLFNIRIRNAVVLSENLTTHEGVTDYAPKSAAADDFRQLVEEIERSV